MITAFLRCFQLQTAAAATRELKESVYPLTRESEALLVVVIGSATLSLPATGANVKSGREFEDSTNSLSGCLNQKLLHGPGAFM